MAKARRRDVIAGIIIGLVFLVAFVFMGIIFIGLLTGDGDLGLVSSGGNIGVIEIHGVIDEEMGRKIIEHIDDWTESDRIKALVLHINTPGGGVAIAQEIYDAVLRAKEEKPVVSSVASMAASAGYYIACASDRIVANPGSVTGSIGVIFQFQTFRVLMTKLGIRTETIKSGELKDVGSFNRDMTEKERLMLRAVVMDSYEQFVEVVALGRGMEKEDIYPLADGSIFTGSQALNLGLVDSLGGLNEAVGVAAELAGIEGEPVIVRPYEKKKISIFDLFDQALGLIDRAVESDMAQPRLLYQFGL